MKISLLFRTDFDSADKEFETAKDVFGSAGTYDSRCKVGPGEAVLGRYSVLPWYQELERDLTYRGSTLLQNYQKHLYIATMEWAFDGVLADLTPRTWTQWFDLPKGVAFVVKGRTNSRKSLWDKQMFAPSADRVPDTARALLMDGQIRDQGLVVREYKPLKKLAEGLNGLPITNEWRTFWFKDRLLCKGFYWKGSHPEVETAAEWTVTAETVAAEAARRLAARGLVFFVVDVAQLETGSWIVIEINDGQMSGLCGCEAEDLYTALQDVADSEFEEDDE